jgi:CDP-diacylglycerol--serine O-phosphatidyltransferase
VSFGAAPALVIYEWSLKGMDKLGWFAAFVYCACAALRLARFNTNIDVVDKHYFQGLPSPAAAGLIAGLVWAMESYDVARADVPLLAWGLTLFAGITMVSSVRFYSGKDINLRKSVPFRVVVMIALGVVALMQVANNLPEVLFGLFAIYAASGYAMWAWERLRRKPPAPPSAL